mmetsp:Transcript_54228/g.156703  ORF Transcript_54228/g.156703 Transcript_54228/m.156703 type:complete len:404 (+) Transcript_54228:641-1852(+)
MHPLLSLSLRGAFLVLFSFVQRLRDLARRQRLLHDEAPALQTDAEAVNSWQLASVGLLDHGSELLQFPVCVRLGSQRLLDAGRIEELDEGGAAVRILPLGVLDELHESHRAELPEHLLEVGLVRIEGHVPDEDALALVRVEARRSQLFPLPVLVLILQLGVLVLTLLVLPGHFLLLLAFVVGAIRILLVGQQALHASHLGFGLLRLVVLALVVVLVVLLILRRFLPLLFLLLLLVLRRCRLSGLFCGLFAGRLLLLLALQLRIQARLDGPIHGHATAADPRTVQLGNRPLCRAPVVILHEGEAPMAWRRALFRRRLRRQVHVDDRPGLLEDLANVLLSGVEGEVPEDDPRSLRALTAQLQGSEPGGHAMAFELGAVEDLQSSASVGILAEGHDEGRPRVLPLA